MGCLLDLIYVVLLFATPVLAFNGRFFETGIALAVGWVAAKVYIVLRDRELLRLCNDYQAKYQLAPSLITPNATGVGHAVGLVLGHGFAGGALGGLLDIFAMVKAQQGMGPQQKREYFRIQQLARRQPWDYFTFVVIITIIASLVRLAVGSP